jgi:hypothetical protein
MEQETVQDRVRSALEDQRAAEASLRAAKRDLAWAVQDAVGLGATWKDVGDLLGTSAQAAWERFGKRPEHQGGAQ